jgi:hypothetical protein
VAAGTKVTLSGQVSGWPPPFTFEWRLGASTLQSNVQNEPFTFFTVTAPTNGLAISYRAIVRNRALPSGRITPFTVITPLPDSDNDGLPDQWETTFGATETLADTDGDQMLNWQEYQAGTDPTNALSYLKFDSMIWSNGMLRLEFQAASNRTYAVQFNADLGSTNWQTVSHVTARSTPRTAVVVEPPGPTVRFYRIVTPHP